MNAQENFIIETQQFLKDEAGVLDHGMVDKMEACLEIALAIIKEHRRILAFYANEAQVDKFEDTEFYSEAPLGHRARGALRFMPKPGGGE